MVCDWHMASRSGRRAFPPPVIHRRRRPVACCSDACRRAFREADILWLTHAASVMEQDPEFDLGAVQEPAAGCAILARGGKVACSGPGEVAPTGEAPPGLTASPP